MLFLTFLIEKIPRVTSKTSEDSYIFPWFSLSKSSNIVTISSLTFLPPAHTDCQRRTMSVLDHSPQQGGGPDLVNIEVMLNHSELFRAEC